MAAAEGVSTNTNKLNWWKSQESDLPNWSSACKVALLTNLLQLRQSEFFHFSQTVLVTDRLDLVVWKSMLKHLSHFSISNVILIFVNSEHSGHNFGEELVKI